MVWLRNAKNQSNIAGANDDISYQMQGADSAEDLNTAINTATTIVQREQGGYLTPHQSELIQNLQNRIQDQSFGQDIYNNMHPSNNIDLYNNHMRMPTDINENSQNSQQLNIV